MKKVSTSGSKNILLVYILKVVITAILSILLFTYIFGKITYKFDLDLKYDNYFAMIICVLCAAITAFISVLGFKNNGLILGAAAQVPLLFYSILNVIFNGSSLLFFIIKAVLVICTGMLIGHITSQKSGRLRIK
ncbi:MAG: TIGR04086 family membrane protein [Eubacterium sp.]|nr:TIGR04086 family membrane protein [Eubacterium sp.]MBR0412009.1 TIGR04086 family membrane protein [Eubacterium sp.]